MTAQMIMVLAQTLLQYGPEAYLKLSAMFRQPSAVTDADIQELAAKSQKTMAQYYAEARAEIDAMRNPIPPAPVPPT